MTIPEELLEEVRSKATQRGMSAYVADALSDKLDQDRLKELSDWLQEEYGPITDEERAAAEAELEALDAEHARRRAAAAAGENGEAAA